MRNLVVFLQSDAAVDISGLGSEQSEESPQDDYPEPWKKGHGFPAAFLQNYLKPNAENQVAQNRKDRDRPDSQRIQLHHEFQLVGIGRKKMNDVRRARDSESPLNNLLELIGAWCHLRDQPSLFFSRTKK
jgi:hypothetical protein